MAAIHSYVTTIIGKEFLVSPIIEFSRIFTASSAKHPILIHPTDDMNPMPHILKASQKHNGAKIISIDHHTFDVRRQNA